MSAKTSIQWTGRTWNPIAAFLKVSIKVGNRTFPAGTRGWFCVKVSPGCLNCYAEGINLRLGNGLAYAKVNLDQIEWRLVNLQDPLKWRKPQTVFVDSMSDLFYAPIPDAMIDAVFAVMAMCPQHTFQVLTKRQERMRDYVTGEGIVDAIHGRSWRIREAGHAFNVPIGDDVNFALPLPNVWLGVSAENQKCWDERVERLGATPAAIRFVSVEPLLGHIGCGNAFDPPPENSPYYPIDWVIVGGESGKQARPCNIEWLRSIVAQCQSADVPVFVKQLGKRPFEVATPIAPTPEEEAAWFRCGWTKISFADGSDRQTQWNKIYRLRDSHGGDMSEWPDDLRIRQFPKAKVAA